MSDIFDIALASGEPKRPGDSPDPFIVIVPPSVWKYWVTGHLFQTFQVLRDTCVSLDFLLSHGVERTNPLAHQLMDIALKANKRWKFAQSMVNQYRQYLRKHDLDTLHWIQNTLRLVSRPLGKTKNTRAERRKHGNKARGMRYTYEINSILIIINEEKYHGRFVPEADEF